MNESPLETLTPTDTKRLDSVRLLTRMLMMSGCCNFVALLVGLYGCFVGNFWLPPHHVHRLNPFQGRTGEHRVPPSLSHTLHHFHLLSLHQLVECLAETDCVEEGYPIRDLALSFLVWQHHFDVARATELVAPAIHPTVLSLSIDGKPCTLPLYLGLTSAHIDAILAFGRREQWPVTPRAMFALLKDPTTACNLSLRDSFCLCPLFQVLYKSLLGGKQEGQESTAHGGWSLNFCLDRVLEGDWQQFMESVRAVVEHSTSIHLARQTFLSFYPPEKELKQEKEALPGVCNPKEIKETVCRAKVTNKAVDKGVERAVDKVVGGVAKNVVKNVAVAQTQTSGKRSTTTPSATYSIPKLYVVRTGDSLWKIARAFQVDVEKIKAYNALQSDRLHPGLSLLIP